MDPLSEDTNPGIRKNMSVDVSADRPHQQEDVAEGDRVHPYWFFGPLGILGLLMATVAHKGGPAPSSMAFFGLTLCQTTIVGAWAALRPLLPSFRVLIPLIASGFLSLQLALGIDQVKSWTILIATGSCIGSAGVLAVWRYFTRCLLVAPSDTSATEALQFGIRHLVFLTVIVAVVSALLRAVRPQFGNSEGETLLMISRGRGECDWSD